MLAELPEDDVARIEDMITQITPLFPKIEEYAASVHPQHRTCRVVKEKYVWGQSFAVFEIVFEDEEDIETVNTGEIKERLTTDSGVDNAFDRDQGTLF